MNCTCFVCGHTSFFQLFLDYFSYKLITKSKLPKITIIRYLRKVVFQALGNLKFSFSLSMFFRVWWTLHEKFRKCPPPERGDRRRCRTASAPAGSSALGAPASQPGTAPACGSTGARCCSEQVYSELASGSQNRFGDFRNQKTDNPLILSQLQENQGQMC